MTMSTLAPTVDAVLFDSDDLAEVFRFRGTPRQKRKKVYGLLEREGRNFGMFELNGRLVCHRSRVLRRLEEMANAGMRSAADVQCHVSGCQG
jgi:hypothetical protein